ncbi:hypothetical protein V1293_006648 [Bradyrhizobium sp. AZCC 1693]
MVVALTAGSNAASQMRRVTQDGYGQKRHLTDAAPFPVYPDQQTLGLAFTRSPKGQCTKSLRDSPLRGEPDREHGSRGQDRR